MGNDRAPIQRSLAQLRPFNPPTLRFFDTSPDPPNTLRNPFSDRGGWPVTASAQMVRKTPTTTPLVQTRALRLTLTEFRRTRLQEGVCRLSLLGPRSELLCFTRSRQAIRDSREDGEHKRARITGDLFPRQEKKSNQKAHITYTITVIRFLL